MAMAKQIHNVATCAAALLVFGFAQNVMAAEFEAPLIACVSNGTAVGGVNSCGKIWKLKSGKAELKHGGKLKVTVKGLVLNDASVGKFNGTPDGVDAVAAAVICNSPTGPTVVGQLDPVPLSKKGDAKAEGKIALPSNCVGLVIVLRERYEGKIGGWLAGTGM